MRGTLRERIEAKQIKGATPDDCYGWNGARTGREQRPCIKVNGKNIHAARALWMDRFGEITNGLLILHTCDNNQCTNLKHLYIGSAWRNARDREERGRGRHEWLRGEDHPNSYLTDADVTEIRRLWDTGRYTQKYIAEMFGISSSATVSNIVRGITRLVDDDEGVTGTDSKPIPPND
jgi:hypothetical protein